MATSPIERIGMPSAILCEPKPVAESQVNWRLDFNFPPSTTNLMAVAQQIPAR